MRNATILFEQEDPLYYQWCRAHYGNIPKQINVKYVVNSHGNMLQAVSRAGVAVVQTMYLIEHTINDLGFFDESFEVSNGNFYLVYHKESLQLKRVEKTIEFLLAIDNPLNRSLKYN